MKTNNLLDYRLSNDDPTKQKIRGLMDTYLPREKLNIKKVL